MMNFLHHGLVPGARNCWSDWVDAAKKRCGGGIDACLFTAKGMVNAYTRRFAPSASEIQTLNRILENATVMQESMSTLRFNDRTYVIKRTSLQNEPDVVACADVWPRDLVAFSGSKYLLVCRSKTMYIVALVENRGGKIDDDLRILTGMVNKLIANGY